MTKEELVNRYLEEGCTQEEAEAQADKDLEEQEQLDWYRYHEHVNRRP